MLAIELAVAGLFVRPGGRVTALAAMFALSVFADIATAGIRLAVPLLAAKFGSNEFWTSTYIAAAGYGAEIIWWIGAMVCVVGSLEQESLPRRIGRVAALWVALFAANARGAARAGLRRTRLRRPRCELVGVSARQVRRELRPSRAGRQCGSRTRQPSAGGVCCKPRSPGWRRSRKGETAIYALGIAGWAGLDVFAKEIDGGLASIARILPIKDRTLRLINNPATVASVPLASPHNFTAAVHAIGNVMNKDDDVLVLLMTSHGDRKGFALQLPDQAPIDLTPKQVAETLDHEGIKYRVVIVSACFSGIFLPPLANDNTIVVTAADDQHTSFGCAPERDWTYFGDAFLRQSLQPGTDFEQAFAHARTLIQGWELMDHAPPSNPQAHFGPALVAKLAPFFAAPPAADGQ